jgi:hypothetical protein
MRPAGKSGREAAAAEKPFPDGRAARPQADGDPDFAGDRSAAAEDVAQTGAPENGGWSGAEDNVEKRPPGSTPPSPADPRHRGDRRS